MEREIKISNDLNEISVLASFIEELGEELSLSFETTMNINLALEEAVANIIMYAYPTQEQHTILLRVTYSEKQLVFLLTDKGASFDPTQVDEVDVTLIGGTPNRRAGNIPHTKHHERNILPTYRQ